MTWTRLSDTFAEEMEAAELDPDAVILHVAALCYCNRLLTDGKIPARKIKTLYPLEDPELAAKALVDADLWTLSEDGQSYQIANFLTDQRPAEKVLREREANRVRQQNWQDVKRGHKPRAVETTGKPATETTGNGKGSPAKKTTAKKTPAKKRTNAPTSEKPPTTRTGIQHRQSAVRGRSHL
jgi:hypothetical protein